MAATAISHFDILSYVKKARELGVSEQVAELQARQFEQSIEDDHLVRRFSFSKRVNSAFF